MFNTNTYKSLILFIFTMMTLVPGATFGQNLANNPCAYPAAALWPLDGTCYANTTAGMSYLYATGTCNSAGADDGWAWFVGDGNNLTVTYTPDTRDGILHVFTDDGTCTVAEVGCSDVAGNGGTETVTISPSTVGQIYLVRIQRWNSNWTMTGCLSVTSTAPPVGGGGDDCASADRIDCGDPILAGETTVGNTNTATNWGCHAPITTPGEDHYYVVQWPDAANGGTIRFNFTNVADANDTYLEFLALDNPCVANTCTDGGQLTISTGLFGTATNFYEYTVPAGITDYYFVVDAQNDGIDSYDLEVTCFLTGLELDQTNSCTPIPVTAPANQGYYQTWDGAEAPATADPAALTGTYTICENLYILNVGWEWLKTFDVTLGACWINTSNYSPNGTNNGQNSYACGGSTGNWSAALAAGVINWSYVHGQAGGCGNTAWGDGSLLNNNYTCALYSFCYDAQVDPTCSPAAGFQNGVSATDDGIGGGGGSGVNPSNVTLGTTSPTLNNLPVALLSFNAKPVENNGRKGVMLNWKTASEINNDYFSIERSTDGINFAEIFQMKGAGNGTSTDLNNYVGVDENPNNGINYYRLKQVDFNGNFEYFNVEVVDFSDLQDVTLSPNTVDNELNVSFDSKYNNSEYQIKIYDIRGSLMYENRSEAVKGENNLVLNTKEFAQGLYIILLENGAQVHKLKFVRK